MFYRSGARRISTHAPLAGRDLGGCRTSRKRSMISTHAPLAGRDLGGWILDNTLGISTHAPLAGRDFLHLHLRLPCSFHFNPRAPCGARRTASPHVSVAWIFQPTRPLRGATVRRAESAARDGISTHAPLAGRDGVNAHQIIGGYVFQPTRPLRGATQRDIDESIKAQISTHAPLAGRDRACGTGDAIDMIISTHAPLAGRDFDLDNPDQMAKIFQPTRPLRGATQRTKFRASVSGHFNPRAPCGARRYARCLTVHRLNISTHAPLAGRDANWREYAQIMRISTHAPLAGRDPQG